MALSKLPADVGDENGETVIDGNLLETKGRTNPRLESENVML